MARSKEGLWEPFLGSESSPRFANNYGGIFAQKLELNRLPLDNFLSIGSLDGQVRLTESTLSIPRSQLDINLDGSVTGKGRLRWGEEPTVTDEPRNYCYQVKADPQGWIIAINGNLIAEDLMKKLPKEGARDITSQFAKRFNSCLRVGLKEALLRDKCTFTKDPFLIGRLVATTVLLFTYYKILTSPDFGIYFGLGINSLALYAENFRFREENDQELERAKKYRGWNIFMSRHWLVSFHRRTVGNMFEGMSLPFEADKLVLGCGYLELQKLRRKQLVRSTIP